MPATPAPTPAVPTILKPKSVVQPPASEKLKPAPLSPPRTIPSHSISHSITSPISPFTPATRTFQTFPQQPGPRLPPSALFFRQSTQRETETEFQSSNNSEWDYMQSQPEMQSQPVVYADLEESKARRQFLSEQSDEESHPHNHNAEAVIELDSIPDPVGEPKIAEKVVESRVVDPKAVDSKVVDQKVEKRKKCFGLTGFKPNDKERITNHIKTLAGSVCTSQGLTDQVTHLLCPVASRSEKFFSACLKGLWILGESYMVESWKCSRFVEEQPHELKENPNLAKDLNDLARAVVGWRKWKAKSPDSAPLAGVKILIDLEKDPKSTARIFVAGGAQIIRDKAPFSSRDIELATVIVSVGDRNHSAALPVWNCDLLFEFITQAYKLDQPVEWWEDSRTPKKKRSTATTREASSKRAKH
eukprot:c17480_g1_i1.p1 GENE.c17480_g1_i1~~c17480_g1_i1.p1  ORF type:complete len:476 (-),score=93.92 c17480_g1_i1:8-1255(-)